MVFLNSIILASQRRKRIATLPSHAQNEQVSAINNNRLSASVLDSLNENNLRHLCQEILRSRRQNQVRPQ